MNYDFINGAAVAFANVALLVAEAEEALLKNSDQEEEIHRNFYDTVKKLVDREAGRTVNI